MKKVMSFTEFRELEGKLIQKQSELKEYIAEGLKASAKNCQSQIKGMQKQLKNVKELQCW